MSYILSTIIRTKQFSPGISELVFKKPVMQPYKPGDKLKLLDFDRYYYIASGMQEVWSRIIIDDKVYINTPSIRFEREPINDIPNLLGTEPSKTVMICDELGIGPALAFCGTYPRDKFAKIIYKHSGKGVNEEWLNANQNVIHAVTVEAETLHSIPIEKDYNYYICCSKQENTFVKDYLLNKGVSDSVMFISSI